MVRSQEMSSRSPCRWKTGRNVAACGAIVLLILTSGCGPGGVTVRGEVAVDGKPLDEGTISFKPADGVGPSMGGAIAMGRYNVSLEAPNAAGPKTVTITGIRRTGRQIPAGPPEPAGTTVAEIVIVEFGKNGELTCQLTSGNNEHNFDLASP